MSHLIWKAFSLIWKISNSTWKWYKSEFCKRSKLNNDKVPLYCSTRLQLSFLAFRELLNLIEVQFTDRSELEPVVERIFERIVGQVIRKVGHLGSHWGCRRNSMGGIRFSVAADSLVFPSFFAPMKCLVRCHIEFNDSERRFLCEEPWHTAEPYSRYDRFQVGRYSEIGSDISKDFLLRGFSFVQWKC